MKNTYVRSTLYLVFACLLSTTSLSSMDNTKTLSQKAHALEPSQMNLVHGKLYDESDDQSKGRALSEEDSESTSDKEDEDVITLSRAYFSPNIREVLKTLISHETKGVWTAQYNFLQYDVSQVWADQIDAVPDLKGAVIVDKGYSKKYIGALKLLHDKGVKLKAVTTERKLKSPHKLNQAAKFEIMHHKFFIFGSNARGRRLIITGSYNNSGKSSESNWENIVLLDDKKSVDKFIIHFNLLLKQATTIPTSHLKALKHENPYTLRLNGKGSGLPRYKKDARKLVIRAAEEGSQPQALFSPDIRAVVCNLISHEKQGIQGAVYSFSADDYARAWEAQRKNNDITSRLFLDKEFNTDLIEAVKRLKACGVELLVTDKPRSLTSAYKGSSLNNWEEMHHKFLIFEDTVNHRRLVITGSCNLGGHANEYNWENLVIIDDTESIDSFLEELVRLEKYSRPIKDSDLKYKGTLFGSYLDEKRALESLPGIKKAQPRWSIKKS